MITKDEALEAYKNKNLVRIDQIDKVVKKMENVIDMLIKNEINNGKNELVIYPDSITSYRGSGEYRNLSYSTDPIEVVPIFDTLKRDLEQMGYDVSMPENIRAYGSTIIIRWGDIE